MNFVNQEQATHLKVKGGREPNLMVNNLIALNAGGKVNLIRNLLRAIKSTGISRLIAYILCCGGEAYVLMHHNGRV